MHILSQRKIQKMPMASNATTFQPSHTRLPFNATTRCISNVAICHQNKKWCLPPTLGPLHCLGAVPDVCRSLGHTTAHHPREKSEDTNATTRFSPFTPDVCSSHAHTIPCQWLPMRRCFSPHTRSPFNVTTLCISIVIGNRFSFLLVSVGDHL